MTQLDVRLMFFVPFFLGVLGTSAHGARVDVNYWEHGVWKVRQYHNPDFAEFGGCEVWTGGDGAGTLRIDVGEGGSDASVSYVPVTYRGMPSPLLLDDWVSLVVDGDVIGISDELEVFQYQNDYDDWEVSADASNYMVSETVQALRAGNTMEVAVTRQGRSQVYETYSLRGFTATWLKASEWCRFDPDRQFQTF